MFSSLAKKNQQPAGQKDPVVAAEEVVSSPSPVVQQSSGKSGFQLYLEQNRSELQADQPGASEAELVRLAAQKFKSLPEDERQVLLLTF